MSEGLEIAEKVFDEASLDNVRISRHFEGLAPHRFITLLCTECGKTWQHEIDCGDRLCPRCNANRRKRIMDRYLPVVRQMARPKFITLTVPRRPLTERNVERLREAFTRLRHRKVWKAVGGIYQIEIGTLDDLGNCNLHIHAIIDSDWMSQKELSQAWLEITGDGYIVDIREAKGDRDLLRYMTKHLVKMPSNVPDWQHDLINEVLHDTRLVQGFGSCHRLNLPLRMPVCPFCGALGSVIVCDFEPMVSDFSGVA